MTGLRTQCRVVMVLTGRTWKEDSFTGFHLNRIESWGIESLLQSQGKACHSRSHQGAKEAKGERDRRNKRKQKDNRQSVSQSGAGRPLNKPLHLGFHICSHWLFRHMAQFILTLVCNSQPKGDQTETGEMNTTLPFRTEDAASINMKW